MRHLNLLEYQSKNLLDEAGVAIQKFRVLESNNDGKVLDNFSKIKILSSSADGEH